MKKSQHHQLNQIMFSSDLVEIGLFDCPRQHPLFHDSGPISQYLVVFPRRAVCIQHGGSEPVVANRRVATLYNDGQEYRRSELSKYGDQSIWLRFRKAEVVEALIACGRTHGKIEAQPFAWTHSHSDATTYLMQRQLSRTLLDGTPASFLEITETALQLLQRVVSGTAGDQAADKMAEKASTKRRHRRLVSRCEELLTTQYQEKLTLESIATQLATTPFHLSRIFSSIAGKSIHQQILDLRLRCAIDRLIDAPHARITDVSLELGFSTPSHFTQTFRRYFGITPRQFLAC